MKNAKIVFLTFLPLLWEITTKRTHAKTKSRITRLAVLLMIIAVTAFSKQLRQKKCKNGRYCRYHSQR